MKKKYDLFDLNEGLSVEELEDRHELSVILSTEGLEAGERGGEPGEGTNGGVGGDPGLVCRFGADCEFP